LGIVCQQPPPRKDRVPIVIPAAHQWQLQRSRKQVQAATRLANITVVILNFMLTNVFSLLTRSRETT
jgi:hypothetical protein